MFTRVQISSRSVTFCDPVLIFEISLCSQSKYPIFLLFATFFYRGLSSRSVTFCNSCSSCLSRVSTTGQRKVCARQLPPLIYDLLWYFDVTLRTSLTSQSEGRYTYTNTKTNTNTIYSVIFWHTSFQPSLFFAFGFGCFRLWVCEEVGEILWAGLRWVGWHLCCC